MICYYDFIIATIKTVYELEKEKNSLIMKLFFLSAKPDPANLSILNGSFGIMRCTTH